MAHPALVSMDVLQGELVVSLLEQAGMKPWIALWLLSDEYSDWRLVIAEKSLDDLSPFDQLRRTKDILRQTISETDIPPLWIIRTTDSFSRGLSKRFSKVKTTTPLRLSSTYVGDRFVEDAYVYRIR